MRMITSSRKCMYEYWQFQNPSSGTQGEFWQEFLLFNRNYSYHTNLNWGAEWYVHLLEEHLGSDWHEIFVQTYLFRLETRKFRLETHSFKFLSEDFVLWKSIDRMTGTGFEPTNLGLDASHISRGPWVRHKNISLIAGILKVVLNINFSSSLCNYTMQQ